MPVRSRPMSDPARACRASARREGGTGGMAYGAGRDLERTIRTHLFVICPNHSGSTFLREALATSQAAWSLPGEADRVPGFVRPAPLGIPSPFKLRTGGQARSDPCGSSPERSAPRNAKLWAASQVRIDRLTDPGGYDWARNRKAWYFMARARDPRAPVFVAQAPRALFQVEMLAQSFRNARFVFMVRNPYAAGEGICRAYRQVYRERNGADPPPAIWQGRGLEEWAAMHLVNCLARQRRNVEAHGDRPRPIGGEPRGVFFTYEAMCAEPERVGREIRAMVPELGDLNLHQRLPVKRRYDEMLTDMNARQIARLGAGQVAAFNRVFHEHRDLFDHFGYEMLDAGAFRPEGAPLPRERASPGRSG